MKQKWLGEIESYIDAIPYGEVSLSITRVNRHTVQVTTEGTETLRYTDNEDAAKDIARFLSSLIDDKHTGKVQFEVEFKDGQISILAIKNTRKTKY
jgi:hypothetical protein